MTTKGSYTDLTTLKDYCKIAGSNTDDDTALTSLITAVSDWIDNYCQRTFGSEAGTVRTVNGTGSFRVAMPEDLQAVTLLEVALYEGATYSTVPGDGISYPSDFYLEPKDNLPGRPYRWIDFGLLPTTSIGAFYRGHRTVRVTGTWGWSAVPASVANACLEICKTINRARRTGDAGEVGEGQFGSQKIGRFVTSDVKAMLHEFQIVRVGSSAPFPVGRVGWA